MRGLGSSKRRSWRKIHIAVDEQTLEVCPFEVTSNAIADAPVLADLLDQTAPQKAISFAATGGAYDTKADHDARGAVALILPRKNARLWKPRTDEDKVHNDALRTF